MRQPFARTPFEGLTPALVLELRASIRWRVASGSIRPEAHIVLLPAEGKFAVWTDGRPQCAHADPAVCGYLLQAERAQPGFVAAILDTRTDPETACLEPVERAARLAAQRESAARIRAREAEDDAQRREANRRIASGIPSTNPLSLAYKPPVSDVEFDEL